MPILAADPWSPERGMGYEAVTEETSATADPSVETPDWSTPLRPLPDEEPGPVWFVDGVRRVDLRLVAIEGGRRAFGLFGTAAAGAVHCDGRAAFDQPEVGRWIVVGGGMPADTVRVRIGSATVDYAPKAEPGGDPNAPVDGLHSQMQAIEANLAARLAGHGQRLVLADGRLGFLDPTASPVVGVVKRFVRAYLEPEHDALLPRLGTGERTPLFGLIYEGQPLERYAWYTRICPMRAPWHDHAGLVRCEVRAGVGLDGAVALADRVSALLPRFAGRAGDPRSPQNLAPVAALEAWLQHRMGHRGLVRRSLTAWLVAQGQGT
jgi:hypothetical protein